MTHKDICIKFTVGGRDFEAVGFLNEGETYIVGDEMLKRVPDAIGEEDVKFLEEYLEDEWSQELWKYFLVTARRDPGYPRDVRCFDRLSGEWGRVWGGLGSQWGGGYLVLRRIISSDTKPLGNLETRSLENRICDLETEVSKILTILKI